MRGEKCRISSVDPTLLAPRLVSNVEEVALRATSITHQYVAAMFTTIKEDSLIQSLSLRAADLDGFEISTQVLAKLVRKLKTLNLAKTWLPAGMVKVISETVAESAGNLKTLNMYIQNFDDFCDGPQIIEN